MNTEQYQQPEQYSVFEEVEQESPLIYASTGQRFLNHLIDSAVCYGLVFLTFFILGLVQRLTGADLVSVFIDEYGEATGWIYVAWLALLILMYTVSEGTMKGKTIGKLATGTRAVREDGSTITWKDAFLRTLCRLIPFDALSALGGHPWHDSIVKTMVIKTRNINA